MDCTQVKIPEKPFRSQRTLSAHPSPLEMGGGLRAAEPSNAVGFGCSRCWLPFPSLPLDRWQPGLGPPEPDGRHCTRACWVAYSPG